MDKATSIMTMTVYGMPTWWLGMLIIMFFAYILKLFPSGGMHSTPPPTGIAYYVDILYHITLPVLTLVIIGFWGRAFLIRNIVLGILQEDYIMAARARGLPERNVLYGHVMRTASPPIATMAVLSLLASVGGNLVFEGVFSWPGLGNLYWIAIEQNDIPVLMGCLSVTTALYILGLVVLDLIYGYLDPRIKVGGKR
jgi:peptide/nickel transport system permease protein